MLEMSDFIIILLLRSANYIGIGAKLSINYRVQGTFSSPNYLSVFSKMPYNSLIYWGWDGLI